MPFVALALFLVLIVVVLLFGVFFAVRRWL